MYAKTNNRNTRPLHMEGNFSERNIPIYMRLISKVRKFDPDLADYMKSRLQNPREYPLMFFSGSIYSVCWWSKHEPIERWQEVSKTLELEKLKKDV